MNALVKSAVAKACRGKDWNPYTILGIRKGATAKQIRAAYRRRAKAVHSDVTGDAEEFLALKEAHDFLLDPVARSLWDRKSIRATEDLRKRAIAALSSLFATVVDQLADGSFPPEHADLPDMVRKVVRSQLEDLARANGQVKNRLRRLQLMEGKTRRSGGGENLVASILKKRISECETSLVRLADDVSVGDVILAELEVYSADTGSLDPDLHDPRDERFGYRPRFSMSVFFS